MKVVIIFFGLLLFLAMGAPSSLFAQIKPDVSASVIRNFARVSFTATDPIKFRSAVKGRQIRLRFDKPVTVSAEPLLSKLKPYVISVSQSKDNRSLLLTTNRDYRIRSFVSGKSSGIDIIGLQKGGVKEADKTTKNKESVKEKAAKQPQEKPKEKKLLISSKPRAKPTVPQKAKIVEKPEPKHEIKPETPKIAAAKESEPKPAPESKPKPIVEKPAITEPKPVEEPKSEPEPKPEIKAETEKVEIHQEPNQIAAPVEKVEVEKKPSTSAKNASPNTIRVEDLEEGVALIFPWDERVAAATFNRGGRLLIVFNHTHKFDAKAAKTNKFIENIKSINISGKEPAQLWVIKTALKGAKLIHDNKSYEWRVEIFSGEELPNKLLKPQPKTEPPLRPHLFIPGLEISTPVKFTDPLVGDKLTAIPFYEAGVGLVPPRRFAEFAMLRTVQGLVIYDAIPELRIARTRSGLKITAPDGIMISQDLPPVQLPEPEVEESAASDSFFPYQNWITPLDEDSEQAFENRLWRQSSSKNKKKKRAARKRLAELYLAQGKAVEAKTLLKMIAQDSPIYFTRNKMYALLGAAYFMSYDFNQADTAFKHPTLEKEPELDFWRDILNIILRGEGKADYKEYYSKYISHYPPSMRQRLALVAADHLINRKKYNKALMIFDTLNKANMLDDIADHVEFLIGRVLAGTTQKDAARTMWKQLAEKTDNRYIRPRALFAITNLDLAENHISLEDAVRKLEPLRIMWRGDQFEINLLTLMTRLYDELGMYREALRTYRDIVTYFPNYPKNIEITAKMADIFKQLFNEGGADKLQPLQALALYYEFRNLTPIGEDGDKMIQNLADRLTSIDLLGRAAALLQHQVEFRLSGEERSRVGARLALIHLLKRKPREALKVLELTGFGGNPEELQHQRSLLTARALMGLDETDRALALLKGDDTRAAKLLELSINWKKKDWPNVIIVAEGLMGNRDDPSLPLNESEVGILMKLAIAYAFEQQQGQLQYLRDYFLPLVKDEKSKELFSFITDDAPIDYRNIAKLTAQISNMESFLSNYRNKIKEEGLSKAVE